MVNLCQAARKLAFGMFDTARSDINRAVQPQKMAFGFRKKRDVAKTKALIRCAVTTQLICTFVFVYVKSRFSYDTAHMFKEG